MLALIWLAIVVVATRVGLDLREWVWRQTEPIRFRFDVTNAMRIGHGVNDDAVALAMSRARVPYVAEGDLVGGAMLSIDENQVGPRFRAQQAERARAALARLDGVPRAGRPLAFAPWPDVWAAYVSQYERAVGDVARSRQTDLPDAPIPDNAYFFDYPPGRLWVITAWLREVRSDPAIDAREDLLHRSYSDAAIGPMRRVNEWHEWFAAAGTFALARRVLRRAGRTNLRATSLATVAALLAWFNPALLLNAHGWPQWDAWVLPYAIWAVYFAVGDRWIMAGALLAVGAMFKGQVLLIAPLLAMWPLFRFDLDAVLRFGAGFVIAAAASLSPWLLRTTPAVVWLTGVLAFACLSTLTIRAPRRSALPRARSSVATDGTEKGTSPWHPFGGRHAGFIWFATLAIAATAWIAGPFATSGAPVGVATMLLLACSAIGAPAIWRGRAVAIVLATIGLATFAAGARFGGTFAWLPVGFQTGRYLSMSMGKVANVPAILGTYYGWQIDSPVPTFGTSVELRPLLRGVFAAGLALVAIGMARATLKRRGTVDANLLVALPAAWALAYAVLPQMHERYLLWASVTSALLAARSIGGLLAHGFLTATQVAMILLAMIDSRHLSQDPTYRDWAAAFRGLLPGVGYAVALMACVLVAWAMTRSPNPNDEVRMTNE